MASDDSTVIYKDIEEFPGYRIGNDGSVLSNRLTGQWRPKAASVNSYGHLKVFLYRGDSTFRMKYVHDLVLSAFGSERPNGYECLHIDGNPSNNHITNLRWGTRKENVSDAFRHGTWPILENRTQSKLTNKNVREIRRRYKAGGVTQKQLAIEYGVAKATIHCIFSGKSWFHLSDDE